MTTMAEFIRVYREAKQFRKPTDPIVLINVDAISFMETTEDGQELNVCVISPKFERWYYADRKEIKKVINFL